MYLWIFGSCVFCCDVVALECLINMLDDVFSGLPSLGVNERTNDSLCPRRLDMDVGAGFPLQGSSEVA